MGTLYNETGMEVHMARSRLSFENPLLSGGNAAEKEPAERGKRGRPRREDLVRDNSTQEGLPIEYTRFSVICKAENVKDLKDYAFTKRITLKSAMDEVIESFMSNYRSNPNNEELLDHTGRK